MLNIFLVVPHDNSRLSYIIWADDASEAIRYAPVSTINGQKSQYIGPQTFIHDIHNTTSRQLIVTQEYIVTNSNSVMTEIKLMLQPYNERSFFLEKNVSAILM